jgi:hypothetical protein
MEDLDDERDEVRIPQVRGLIDVGNFVQRYF